MSRPPTKVYVLLCLVVGSFAALMVAIVRGSLWVPAGPISPRSLIAPITALAALTGVVWLLMVVFRNLAVARGTASVRYYK